MSVTVREIRVSDLPALKEICLEAFGDPEAFIDGFFKLLPQAGTGFICVLDERPVSMAFLLEGLSVNGKKCAYIYGVATAANFRSGGFGSLVVKKCAEYAENSGCEVISTSPADTGLYDWYEKILGVEAAVYCDDVTVSAKDVDVSPLACRSITAVEYNSRREAILSGTAHVRFPDGYMELEAMLCRIFSGGLYALDGGVAACYPEDGFLKIKELLCSETSVPACTAALMKAHGVEKALVHRAGTLSPYVAAYPAKYAENVWWGPILD